MRTRKSRKGITTKIGLEIVKIRQTRFPELDNRGYYRLGEAAGI